MDLIQKFLENNAHKFPKGYPDLTQEEDKKILESLMKGVLGKFLPLTEVELSPVQLKKPFYDDTPFEDRGEKLLDKIKNEEPIELIDGSTAVIDKEASYNAIKFLQNKEYDKLGKGAKLFISKEETPYSLSQFKKTKEFGSGKGSGGGATSTIIQESSQCVVNSIAYHVIGGIIQEDHLSIENIREAYKYVDVNSSLNECLDFILGQEGWKSTFINTSNILFNKYPNKEYEFHRGSEFVNRLYEAFKQTKVGINSDKWNPSDIWMVSKFILNEEFPTNIEELNRKLLTLYQDQSLIGVSLKKVGDKADLKVYNLNESHSEEYKFESVISSPKSKDTIIEFNEGKLQLRTFNYATNFAGEIKGSKAAHGKVGLGFLMKIFRDIENVELNKAVEIKKLYGDLNKDWVEEFHKYYNELVEPIEIEKFKNILTDKNDDWVISKYLSLKIGFIIKNSSNSNKLLNQIIGYSKSSTPYSSVFVKVS